MRLREGEDNSVHRHIVTGAGTVRPGLQVNWNNTRKEGERKHSEKSREENKRKGRKKEG